MAAWPPTRTAVFDPAAFSPAAALSRASSQLVRPRTPPAPTIGPVIRSAEWNIWKPKRPLSQSQPSSTSGLSRARTRATFSSRTVNITLHCDGQSVQTEPASSMSHGRARKRYASDVRAPTGQSSMMLPWNGAMYGRSSKVPTYERAPRSSSWSCSSSATSWLKRTQR